MTAFTESQFSYRPLIWMFYYSCKLTDRINCIHERGLRAAYEDYATLYEDLPKIDGSLTIPHHNIQLVAVEMFKVKKCLYPEIMIDLFQLRRDSNGTSKFIIPNVNSEYMGKLSLQYFGPVV